MTYQIRYRKNNEEHCETVESDTAAGAVEVMRLQHQSDDDDSFELIEVHSVPHVQHETESDGSDS